MPAGKNNVAGAEAAVTRLLKAVVSSVAKVATAVPAMDTVGATVKVQVCAPLAVAMVVLRYPRGLLVVGVAAPGMLMSFPTSPAAKFFEALVIVELVATVVMSL